MSTSARPTIPSALARALPERYRLLRHLATGGMATVWCAEDLLLDRKVAIKIMSERYAVNDLAVRRFKREARAAARVSAHPHAVTIFDVGELEDGGAHEVPRAFIVMEYLAGGSVADALRCGAVSPEDARRWLRQAAAALDHAHARGIVHRDIKPANFLLDPSRDLHVADFGIARLQSEDTITSSGELFGTAGYLSPEQALGRDATSASDRYALAVAAFELLTGGRPFTASHFTAQAREHIETPPPSASEREPSLNPAVDDVLARGMAKAPDARYGTAVEFVEALDEALDSGPGPATARTQALPPVAAASAGAAAAGAAGAITPAVARRPTVTSRRRTPSPGPPRPASSPLAPVARRRPSRFLALLALGVAVIGVALVLTQLSGQTPVKRAATRRHVTAAVNRKPPTTRAKPPAASTSQSSTASVSSPTTASTTPAAASSTPAASPSASALQLSGHNLVAAGNYPAAINVLQEALKASSPGSLTYAYALYDLGDALLLEGNPQAAIPVLRQRLQIPNQTATVQALLDRALRAAGQAPSASEPTTGGSQLPPGHQPGHGQDQGQGQGT